MAKVKDKERILAPIRLSADFSAEALQARREWNNIDNKVLKEKNLQPRILYPAMLSFRIEGKVNGFWVKEKLRVNSH